MTENSICFQLLLPVVYPGAVDMLRVIDHVVDQDFPLLRDYKVLDTKATTMRSCGEGTGQHSSQPSDSIRAKIVRAGG